MIIRHYQPGLINLYDASKHQSLGGVLYLTSKKKHLTALIDTKKIEKQINLLFDKVYQDLVFLDKKHQLVQHLALGLISLSVIGFSLIISPFTFGFISNKIPVSSYKVSEAVQKPTVTPSSQLNAIANNEEKVPVREFKLYIPKIDLYSEVAPNIDISNEDIYKQKLLDNGIAHANGSYLPGEGKGPVFLFAHSTDSIANILNYNAKFFYINNLEKGDLITIYFNGKQYNYEVSGKKIVDPHNLDEIRKSTSSLILSTCWPLGTDWQRLLIFAEQK